jgi:tRNA pseudouridine65 synthase
MLIAKKVVFIHPITNVQLTIEAEFDQQWLEVFDELSWETKIIKTLT